MTFTLRKNILDKLSTKELIRHKIAEDFNQPHAFPPNFNMECVTMLTTDILKNLNPGIYQSLMNQSYFTTNENNESLLWDTVIVIHDDGTVTGMGYDITTQELKWNKDDLSDAMGYAMVTGCGMDRSY